MGVAPFWFIETLFSVEHLEGKPQTIYPFIQLGSGVEQIVGRTAELTLDHRLYSDDSKKVTVTLPVALRKALWNYWTVQEGHYKSLRPTGPAIAH